MIRFYLDENFPKRAAAWLSGCGHAVHDPRGSDGEGIDDLAQFDRAQALGAIFLTTDRDFRRTVPLRRPDHAGIILITLAKPSGQAILDRLMACFLHIDLSAMARRCVHDCQRTSPLRGIPATPEGPAAPSQVLVCPGAARPRNAPPALPPEPRRGCSERRILIITQTAKRED